MISNSRLVRRVIPRRKATPDPRQVTAKCPPVDSSCQPDNLERLREQFREWMRGQARTAVSAGVRDGVTFSAWTPKDLAAKIRQETGAR